MNRNLVESIYGRRFQRRRLKCEKFTPSDGKSSQGELKMKMSK
jgi:hypothetical protein